MIIRDLTANPLILLARLAGIEPTTPWFVAHLQGIYWDGIGRHFSLYLNNLAGIIDPH
jgi:hypothetical protein